MSKPSDKSLQNLRPFKPGQSGNPSGGSKRLDVRALAREHTRDALATLFRVMRDPRASSIARVRAADAVLDRAWGKAVQPTAFVDTEGQDRALAGEMTALEQARRIAFLLDRGMRALPVASVEAKKPDRDLPRDDDSEVDSTTSGGSPTGTTTARS